MVKSINIVMAEVDQKKECLLKSYMRDELKLWDLKETILLKELPKEYLFLRILKDSKEYQKELESHFLKDEILHFLEYFKDNHFKHSYIKTRLNYLRWIYLNDDSGFEKLKWGKSVDKRC